MLAHVNNTQLWYDTLGGGPPLMLLHGGPGLDHTEFRPWVEPLADHFVDEHGTGRSERVAPETASTASEEQDRFNALVQEFLDTTERKYHA